MPTVRRPSLQVWHAEILLSLCRRGWKWGPSLIDHPCVKMLYLNKKHHVSIECICAASAARNGLVRFMRMCMLPARLRHI